MGVHATDPKLYVGTLINTAMMFQALDEGGMQTETYIWSVMFYRRAINTCSSIYVQHI